MVCVQACRLHLDATRVEQFHIKIDIVEVVTSIVRSCRLADEGRVLLSELEIYRASQRLDRLLLVVVPLHLLAVAYKLIETVLVIGRHRKAIVFHKRLEQRSALVVGLLPILLVLAVISCVQFGGRALILQCVDVGDGILLQLAIGKLRALVLLHLLQLSVDELFVVFSGLIGLRGLPHQHITGLVAFRERLDKGLVGVFGLALIALFCATRKQHHTGSNNAGQNN